MGEHALKTYIGFLWMFAACLGASWIYWYSVPTEPRFLLGTVLFAVLLLIIRAFPIRIGERHEISAIDVGVVVAVVMLGPTWAAVAVLPCAALAGGKEWLRTCYVAARSTTEVFLAGMVLSLASGPLLSGTPGSATPVVYATFAAGIVLLSTNNTINAGLLKVKYGQSFGESWKELVEPYLASHAISVLTAGLGVLALLTYGPVAAIVLVAGSVAGQVLVYRSREHALENRELEAEVERLGGALESAGLSFGAMVIGNLGQKDGYTDRHAAATATYARDLARELKLEDERAERLWTAGLLHEVGLFGLPEELLLEAGKPNSVAQSKLAEHPARGEEVLRSAAGFEEISSWVRWHHERPDGRGYPDKLRGRWIPLEAKILAVAQSYAAAVLDKPRKPGLSPEEAREKLVAGMDTELDGTVVRAFLRILDTESEGYRAADDGRFLFPATQQRQPPTGAATRLEEA